jgi:hypothetical protein
VLSVEDWAEIRRLHFAEGMGIRTIAKRLSIARNTVRTAVRRAGPPAYRRTSAVDPYEPQIRALLKDCNTMPATVIAERIGWTRGMTILKERADDGTDEPARQLSLYVFRSSEAISNTLSRCDLEIVVRDSNAFYRSLQAQQQPPRIPRHHRPEERRITTFADFLIEPATPPSPNHHQRNRCKGDC